MDDVQEHKRGSMLSCNRTMIYLDNNATTQLHPGVLAAMEPYLREDYGNPSSHHSLGKRSRQGLERAREQVAALLKARPSEIVFTSGGSEATCAALPAALEALGPQSALVTSTVEHSATTRAAARAEALGHPLLQIPVDSSGQPDLDRLEESLSRFSPALVSFIWANNETGVLSPVPEICALCQKHGALLHLDAVQAIGKVPVRLDEIPAHFVSLSAHKFHGPKGIGALFIRSTVPFSPLILGGGQESGRRSGTENVPGIAGMGAAAELASSLSHRESIASLRDRFEHEALLLHPGTQRNGAPEPRLPNTANLAFPGLDARALLVVLDHLGVCASPGSACGSGPQHGSRVLSAMGFDEARARSSLRFSLSRFTTGKEIDQSLTLLRRALDRVSATMPPGEPVVLRQGGNAPESPGAGPA